MGFVSVCLGEMRFSGTDGPSRKFPLTGELECPSMAVVPSEKWTQVSVLVSVTGSANDNSEFPFLWLLSEALLLSASLSILGRVLQSMTEEGPSLGKCILENGLFPVPSASCYIDSYVIPFVELLLQN